MIEATIEDGVLRAAADEGGAPFVVAVAGAIATAAGHPLTAATLRRMSADQTTLVAYTTLREELLEGGFVQLIHNGYGAFIFVNPFARALSLWGLTDLSHLINRAHKLYSKYHTALETDMSDDEFMALYEQYPAFDALDDAFVEHEEQYTAAVAYYVDAHLSSFVSVQP